MKQHNDPTVEIAYDQNGKLVYRCLYCGEWYRPKKRWAQKYCNQSCNVKACRERNVGLYGVTGGTLSNRRNATTNTEISKKIDEAIAILDIQQHKDKLDKDLDKRRRELEVKEINQNINLGFKKITNKLTWLMVISGIIPFIAGPIRRWILKFFTKKKEEPPKT